MCRQMSKYRQKLTTLSILLPIGVWAFVIPAAQAQWSIQSSLENALYSVNTTLTVWNLFAAPAFGNTYENAYKFVSDKEASTHLQTLVLLKREINATSSCQLRDWEIQNLFKQGWEGTTLRDCRPLLDCRDKKKSADELKKEAAEDKTTTDFAACKSFVTTKYAQKYNMLSKSTSLADSTLGTDIYANGTLDDSPYDILYDIQKIGDVLFTNNEKTSQTLFYTFPNGSIAGLQAIPYNADAAAITPNPIQIAGWGQTWGGQSESQWWTQAWWGQWTQTDWQSAWGNTWGTQEPWTIPPNWSTATDWSVTQPTADWTDIKYSDPYLNSTESSNIMNYICVPTFNPVNTTSPNNQNTTNNVWWTSLDPNFMEYISNNKICDPRWNTDDDTRLTHDPSTDSNNNNWGWWGQGRWPTQSSPPAVADLEWNWLDSNSYEKNSEQIMSCIDKCEGLGFSDKAMCVSKCMCWTYWTKDWLAGISFCTVPVRQTTVVSSKPIPSIQDVIVEMNNVLIALRNSGQLIKHNKTKEFLDTSLSKVKLNKIFAFEVNLNWKPIFSAEKENQNIITQETEQDLENLWNYKDINIVKEKNKYAYYWNRENNSSEWFWQATNSSRNNEPMTTDINQYAHVIKTLNWQIAENVYSFVQMNLFYWDSVWEIVANLHQSADSIKQKIVGR